jgi:hypothetical protein
MSASKLGISSDRLVVITDGNILVKYLALGCAGVI